MQGEFEKQVQQKMETLLLVPSEPVWQKVELAIRKQRNKRRFLFFVLFLLFIGAGGLWYYLNSSTPAATVFYTATPKKISPLPTTAGSIIHRERKPAEVSTLATKDIQDKKAIAIKHSIPGAKTGKLISTPPPISEMPEKKLLPPVSVPAVVEKPAFTLDKTIPATTNSIPAKDLTSGFLKQDSLAQSSITKDTVTVPAEKQTIQPSKKTALSKWRKILYLQFGSSSFQDKLFSTRSLSFTNAGTVSNYPGGSSGNMIKPVATAGFSYGVGAGVEKSISKRWEWSALLQYQYYSTHIKTGSHYTVDTSAYYSMATVRIVDYFANTGTNTYTNRISLVQVNPSLSYRIMKIIPLKLDAGISYGLLVKSTSLTYDGINNIYYLNRNNNVKNFFQFTSSLQFEFGRRAKFRVAPVYQYSLNKLQRYSYQGEAHLSFWGLRSGIKF